MSMFCAAHRLPRAGVDPIDSATAALAIVAMAMRRPPVDETIALVLDADRRGRTVVVIDGTSTRRRARRRRTRRRIDRRRRRTGCLVLATVRPGGGPVDVDDDRWLEASDLADDVGVDLLEWFVIAGDAPSIAANAWCPRELVGEEPRW